MALIREAKGLVCLIVLACLMTAKVVWMILAHPMNFPFNVVKIAAAYEHIEQQHIEKIVLPFSKKSFFSFNHGALKKQLEHLAWVESVSIQRIWPDSLKIVIVERQALAVWNDNSLISKRGKQFFPPLDTFSKDLPKLYGPEIDRQEVLQVYKKLSKIKPRGDFYITQLLKSKSHTWTLMVNDRVEIKLGERSPIDKFRRLSALYPQIFAHRVDELALLDLRYPHGIAVRWEKQHGKQQ